MYEKYMGLIIIKLINWHVLRTGIEHISFP